MKLLLKILPLAVLLIAGPGSARAALFTFGGGAIPDAQNGGLVGVPFQGVVSGVSPNEILNLTVSLEISGGYNFDFHIYLVAPNGTLVTLLDQPGSAFTSGSGFDITLNDTAATGIQAATQIENTPLTGTYQAHSALSAFVGGPANGTWTIFVQDLSPGASGTLEEWSLNITPIPEPATVALGVFGGLFGLAGLVHWLRRPRGLD